MGVLVNRVPTIGKCRKRKMLDLLSLKHRQWREMRKSLSQRINPTHCSLQVNSCFWLNMTLHPWVQRVLQSRCHLHAAGVPILTCAARTVQCILIQFLTKSKNCVFRCLCHAVRLYTKWISLRISYQNRHQAQVTLWYTITYFHLNSILMMECWRCPLKTRLLASITIRILLTIFSKPAVKVGKAQLYPDKVKSLCRTGRCRPCSQGHCMSQLQLNEKRSHGNINQSYQSCFWGWCLISQHNWRDLYGCIMGVCALHLKWMEHIWIQCFTQRHCQ